MRSTALESAAQQSEMLDVVNALYSSKVVDRLQSHGVVVTHDYATKTGAIPLPATFTIESGQEIGRQSKTGMLFRLYSDSPVPLAQGRRAARRLRADALADLRQRPRSSRVYRFEAFQGRPSLRYATARRMTADCIGCHNERPEQHEAGLEGRGGRRASWRSSARSTATSPGRTRDCGGPSC